MFVCLRCGKLFEEPYIFEDLHGFRDPPGEVWATSPCCNDGLSETFRCDICDEYITDDYIKLETGERVCDNCYTEKNIDEKLI